MAAAHVARGKYFTDRSLVAVGVGLDVAAVVLGDAELFDETREAEVEAVVAKGKAQPTVIVDPYPIDLAPVDGGLAPVSYRERIRALGPTNEPTHGKQAVGGEVIEALRHAAGAARSTGRVDLIRRK